jgi:hypothetical protein
MISPRQGCHRSPRIVLFLPGTLLGTALSWARNPLRSPVANTVLDNPKVQVNRVLYEQDSLRAPHTRPQDQVIVFLDDASYDVVYANGKKERRERKSGDVIWHSRGEEAPALNNIGKTYRTVVVNLK